MEKHHTRLSGVLAITAVLPASSAVAQVTDLTIAFTDDGTFTAPFYDESDVRVSGSGTLNLLELNGIGVVGGVSDNAVDTGEFLDVEITNGLLFESFIFTSSIVGNLDGGDIDSFFIEGFRADGTSIGTFDFFDSGEGFISNEYVSLLGGEPVERFRVASRGDLFRLSSLTITTVPAPGAAALASSVLVLARRRRR